MNGSGTGWRLLCILAPLVVLWGAVDRAEALEAFDGRIEAHGFVEIQVRGLDRSFEEEFDLSQWYNVLNVEVELDILPDGWGPFDLLQAYIRGEARYDCIYSGGCGMFPSVNTYGNRSRDLPMRLRDAVDEDYAGVINANEQSTPERPLLRINPKTRDPEGWSVSTVVDTPVASGLNPQRNPNTYDATWSADCPTTGLNSNQSESQAGCVDNRPTTQEVSDGEGFPGFDTLFDSKGADSEIGAYQDYAAVNAYLEQAGETYTFYDPSIKDEGFVIPGSGGIEKVYAPLFRGLADERDDPAYYTLKPVMDWKLTYTDYPGADPSGTTRIMGPWLPKNFFETLATLDDRANPMRGRRTPTFFAVNKQTVRAEGVRYHELDCGKNTGPGGAYVRCPGDPDPGVPYIDVAHVDPVDQRVKILEQLSKKFCNPNIFGVCQQHKLFDPYADYGAGGTLDLRDYPNNDLLKGVFGRTLFGGDYSGIIPCWDTDKTIGNRYPSNPTKENSKFIKQLASEGAGGGGKFARTGCIPHTNVRVNAGEGELPMRPAPDFSNLAGSGLLTAQGLYYPSAGLVSYLEGGGNYNPDEFNISQTDRAWNRGDSQRRFHELKEAYLDMEFLESRLWVRAGIQNIVWGKTELFRTTDQFNPQDFALASLPNLEESRIALLSWRAVYSFYDVGPLEDVRFELAMNFDRFEPTDLGACGEPYTLDVVCALTLGTAIHGVTGLGVAGINKPSAGWKDVDGLEFGGRLEFRWDRFSFAIVDYYGYSDFPYPKAITWYDRNVDESTGMPRKYDASGPCDNRGAFVATEVFGTGEASDTKVLHAGNAKLEHRARIAYRDDPTTANLESLRAVQPTGLRDVFASGEVAPGSLAAANDDWWRTKEAYGLMGVGTDPSCLKPGGAPGTMSENRHNSALAPSSKPFSDPATMIDYSNANALGADGDTFKSNTYVALTVGNDESDIQLQWTKVGSSVDYALAHHPANQQLFAFTCSATVSIAVSLAPAACAWNLWGTDALLAQADGPPFGDLLSLFFAGNQSDQLFMKLWSAILINTKGRRLDAPRTIPAVQLNSDVRDGRTTSVSHEFYGINYRGFKNGTTYLKDTARDPNDALTLDNTLTWEQKLLLGCGPAVGTRCDSGAPVVRVRLHNCNPSQTKCTDSELNGKVDIESEYTAMTNLWGGPANPTEGIYEIVKWDPVAGDYETCDLTKIDECKVWGRGGGIDFMLAEASAVLQSFVGFEGTEGATNSEIGKDKGWDMWLTWASDTAQPGTIGLVGMKGFGSIRDRDPEPFVGGPVCTRYYPDHPKADGNGHVILPGCRGAIEATVVLLDPAGNTGGGTVDVRFDEGYTPHQDGCVFGRQIVDRFNRTFYVRAVKADGTPDVELNDELYETCFNNAIGGDIAGDPSAEEDSGYKKKPNEHRFDATWYSYSKRPIKNGGILVNQTVLGAGTLFHPLAQCEQAGPGLDPTRAGWNPDNVGNIQLAANLCPSYNRNLPGDMLQGNASVFRSELAAFSFNFMTFLVTTSCNSVAGGDDKNDRECFNDQKPWTSGRCSYSTPQYCTNVKGFMGIGGVGRNDVRAAGNADHGRRCFLWHCGADLSLEYKQRNVFGISADFAEDNTKTNWGLEFTWMGSVPWMDYNSMSNTTDSDCLNLTVSVDRPTFINFLNANRTFFFNSQWFFNYIPEHSDGFTSFKNPFNVLATFAVFTGYYQDRLLPQLVAVFDFGSQSAGFLPQLGYRFTEAFSVTFGVSFFVGRSEYVPMPVRGFAPNANRAGPHKYEDGVQRLLANFMRRDEAWMRLRWTF